MIKFILFIFFLVLITCVQSFAQDEPGRLETELKLLENGELIQEEEEKMQAVEAINKNDETLVDSISTTQASVQKENTEMSNHEKDLEISSPPRKILRIRSR